MARRIYSNFFTGLEEYAHPVVQEAIKFVEKRHDEWFRNMDSGELRTIHKVIYYFIKESDRTFEKIRKREREVFQYFCASVVYAEIIKHSCLNKEKLNGDLEFPEEISEKVSLIYLNDIAEKIHATLIETVHLQYGDNDKERDKDLKEIEQILKDNSGQLASQQSRGNIPFLTVYKGKRAEVSLRRGIELYLKPPKDDSNEVKTGDEELNYFPLRVYHNEHHSESRVDKDEKLTDVIKNDYVRKKLFMEKGKHITWIHKSELEYNRNRTLYQIDLIDEKRIRSMVPGYMYRETLRKIVGPDLVVESRNDTPAFKQEDLFISFFSTELFQYDTHDIRKQDLEDYSDRLLKRFVVDERSGMFLGFCFPTVQDSGHSDRAYATGSKNILLLALARGLTKLLFNITNQDAVTSPDGDIHFANPDRREELTNRICFNRENDIGRFEIRAKRTIRGGEFYLGGNDGGIMVEVEIEKILLLACVPLVIVSFMFAGMYWIHEREKRNYVSDYFIVVGSILEVWGSLIGLFLVAVKAKYRKWDFIDMIHSRRRCRSLTELIQALQGKNPSEKRAKAIELCSTVPKPETVFSYYKSCAFTNNGNGEFHVDVDIEVSDLEKAGYKFGVTFYGEQVVADARGIVRKFYIRSENDRKTLHIGDNHERQSRFIFCLPTYNKFVGSRGTDCGKLH